MMSPRERAESDKIVATARLRNAEWHAQDVGRRLGFMSPEYDIARAVRNVERRALIAAYDVLLAMDRGEVSRLAAAETSS